MASHAARKIRASGFSIRCSYEWVYPSMSPAQPRALKTGRRSSATLLTTPIRSPRVRSSRSTGSVSG